MPLTYRVDIGILKTTRLEDLDLSSGCWMPEETGDICHQTEEVVLHLLKYTQ